MSSPMPHQRAPTLYAIIAMKLLKGAAFVTLAIVLYTLSDNNLPSDFQKLLHWLKINPERKFFHDLAQQVAKFTEPGLLLAGAGSFLYSLFSWVEGIGLIFRVRWAGWLAIGESAFFIPIEVYELVRNFSAYVFVILVLNVIIVVYLFQNRDRLFHHHSHRRHVD
ncbi:MAG: DUF2127 domain-containing protein [Verrucomicrobia bacterium]|nr:DUF2127 domain-containing protein [Verrucomicrobiota bacterium]